MATLDLPIDGEQNWGTKVRTAFGLLNDQSSDAGIANTIANEPLSSAAVRGFLGDTRGDLYHIARIDHDNNALARRMGALLIASQIAGSEVSERWLDLTAWNVSANATYGSNLLGTTGVGTMGVVKSFPIAVGQKFHISTTIAYKGSGSGDSVYFGIDTGATGHAPDAGGTTLGIGMSSAHSFNFFRGGSIDASVVAASVLGIGAAPTVNGTYLVSVDADEFAVSFSLRKVGANDFYNVSLSRPAFDAAYPTSFNIVAYITDTRGASGHHIGPVLASKTLAPIEDHITALTVDGLAHKSVLTTNAETFSTEAYRWSVPKSYDPRVGTPVVIFCHQSVTGTHSTPWYDARMLPVTEALNDAGYIVGAAYDHGDRWGNQASLDNYLALYKRIRDDYNVTDVFLMGASMGGLPALNLMTHRSFPTPTAVCLIGPACDIKAIYNNPVTVSLQSSIRAAYGIASDGSDIDAKIAGFNPVDNDGLDFRGVPMRFYSSTGDTSCPPADHCNKIAALTVPYASESSVVLKTGGHLDISQFPPSEIVAFFETYRGAGNLLNVELLDQKANQGDFLPLGGTTGQSLTKLSVADLDVGWVTSGSTVTAYTTAQTDTAYAIPTGAKGLFVRMSGGGGAGGSGRRGASGSVRCGGGGGAGGGYTEWFINVADLAVSTLYVTVGDKGVGGAAAAADDTNGTAGTAGTISKLQTAAGTQSAANSLAYANGGGGGGGGTNAAGTAGAATTGRWFSGAGGAASGTGGVGANGLAVVSAPNGGGSGAGITSADVMSAGVQALAAYGRYSVGGLGGTSGGGAGGAGGNPPAIGFGYPGAGGGSNTGGAGGAGGNGGCGAGGGGGGATANGNLSGKGGDGGVGFVEITAIK